MLEVGQTIRAKVEKVVFGGHGLIRHEGWVIFVEDVAVGELVEVVLTAKKKSYFLSRLKEVVTASPLRVIARCPYFGSCGGCQLQHLAYEEQLRLKASWLQESLERIGKVTLDEPIVCEPSKKQWGYRKKVVLHAHEGKLGYFSRDNETILDIKSCPIFAGPGFEKIKHQKEESRLTVLENGEWFTSAQKERIFEMQIEGVTVFYSPTVFLQNSPEQFLQIYHDVLNFLQTGTLLDLYSGIGILALLAAKRGKRVCSIELSQEATLLAKRSAAYNRLEDKTTFFSAYAENVASLCKLSDYQEWVVNPPRTGLSEKVLKTIQKAKPKQLIYISCLPTTLARDIKRLMSSGYHITKVKAYDMFPQTTHLETIVCLEAVKN